MTSCAAFGKVLTKGIEGEGGRCNYFLICDIIGYHA